MADFGSDVMRNTAHPQCEMSQAPNRVQDADGCNERSCSSGDARAILSGQAPCTSGKFFEMASEAAS
jgi:hypothetical protein